MFGLFQVDSKVPTTILEKGSLLDKKRAEWSAQVIIIVFWWRRLIVRDR
jgi:hypothetical protein